jgi:hypothetical protein
MWYNAITVWLLRSPLHGLFSGNTMVVGYTGRKSGKTYQLPVGYIRLGEKLLTISYKRRTWWRNLRNGAQVTILLQGKDLRGWTEVVENEQGVMEGLTEFIGGNLRTARMFGLNVGANGQPEPESFMQQARERVVVRTTLK